MSTTVPDRAKSDPAIAALLRTLRAMHGTDERTQIVYLEGLIRHLRRQNDDLRDANEGIELALQDSAHELARQDGQIVHLTALTIHQTRTILDLRAERDELAARLGGR